MNAREVKNRLVIDGTIDAAFTTLLECPEPDARRAALIELAHAAVDAAMAAERERWRGFTAHCQRVVDTLKARMTAEHVVAHLDTELDASIARMTSVDTSDLDPDLVECASRGLWPTVASSDTPAPVT